MSDTDHPLTTGQIESTLAHIEDLLARFDLCEDTDDALDQQSAILAKVEDALEALHSSIPERAERIVYVMRSAEAKAQQFKDERTRLLKRQQRYERTAESCRAALARVVASHRDLMGDESANIKTDRVTVSTSSRDSLVAPEAPHLWPEEFVTYTPKLDKRKALKALKSNPDDAPDGFSVIKRESVVIR